MEDTQRVMLQYGAAMAHQEVFQQRIIINQLIRARLRGEEEHPEMAKAAPRETRQFGIYDQLKIEFIKEDPRTFLKSNWKVRIRFWEQEAFRPKIQVSSDSTPPEFWYQVFRHAVLLTGPYWNSL